MCGIAVMASTSTAGSTAGNPARLMAALDRMRHRGPDGDGTAWHWDGRLGLGHRRLAIFETGEAGRQPMVSARTGDTLIFNGSLYNYPELRRDLREKGHSFTTDSDTEVILAAWQEWGEQAFSRFNGTWALALYDAGRGQLILSRDRLGVRPLYLWRDRDRFLAASSLEALITLIGHRPALNPDLVFDYLALGWLDHEARTLYDGIIELPPGSLWILESDGRLDRRHYHRWPEPDADLTAAEAAMQLPDLLLDATQLRLRSHVPLAAQLSGGLDSGTLAWAIGAQESSTTASFSGFFSYGYTASGSAFDEREQALRTRNHVAAHLPFRDVVVDPTPDRADLDALLMAQELPVKTPSSVASLRLYRAMRADGVTVALTGDGSDEIFCGYTRRYLPLLARDVLRQGAFSQIPGLLHSPHLTARDTLARLVWSLPRPVLSRLLARRSHLSVLHPDLQAVGEDRLRSALPVQRLPLADLSQRDITSQLLPEVLRLADRNAMQCGIESRSPFLDHRVVDLAMRLPAAQKVTAQGGKQPLRQAMAPHLPPMVSAGPKMRGLGHAEQFRVGHIDLADVLHDPPAQASRYINLPALTSALRQDPANMRLWWPVCLLLWLRQVENR